MIAPVVPMYKTFMTELYMLMNRVKRSRYLVQKTIRNSS